MINAEEPKWEPSNSTMGNIENSAILTVAKIYRGDRRAILREINALFNRLRRGAAPVEEPATPSLENFF